MPKQTPIYRLGYFTDGERTNSTTESLRWGTIDNLLGALYKMVGDGVVDGWQLSASDGLSVLINSGRGVINAVAVANPTGITLPALIPNTTNYIWANKTATSYWDASVIFTASTLSTLSNAVLIGSVATDAASVVSIDVSSRHNVGLLGSILDAVADHRHNGAEGNPGPINLATDVDGILSQRNLPDIDASQIISGTLPLTVIPEIDHTVGLSHVGNLTHAQLDSFVEALNNPDRRLMGEVALTNLLQLVLALKSSDPTVDAEMVNEVAYVPGYSPSTLVDLENTTAIVDNVNHHITLNPTGAAERFTQSLSQYEQWVAGTLSAVSAAGDLLRLTTTQTKAFIDNFDTVQDWTTSVEDLSSPGALQLVSDTVNRVDGTASGKLTANAAVQNNMTLFLQKSLGAQNWSGYSRLVFNLLVSDLDHGDVKLFIRDASGGEQSTLVLARGLPTVNDDTLQVGWREVSIDISGYARSAVTAVGLSCSTQDGWNPSRQLSWNIDQMYLSSGNLFTTSGTARFTFGRSGFPVRWSAVNLTTMQPAGAAVAWRWRQANALSSFSGDPQTAWSAFTPATAGSSGLDLTSLNSDTDLYAFLQVEIRLTASGDKLYSPEIHELQVEWQGLSTADSFTYALRDQWAGGIQSNTDLDSAPGQVRIAGTANVGGITYAGSLVRADDNLSTILALTGGALPRTTNQMLGLSADGLGQAASFDYGPEGSFWLADTENDRVVQIGPDGSLLFGLYGSWLSEPPDPYGWEERGPGSNTAETAATSTDASGAATAASTSASTSAAPNVLHSIYNPDAGKLTVVFDAPLAAASTVDRDRLRLGAGAHRLWFDQDTTFTLFGIDEAKLEAWSKSGNAYLPQFIQQSHILQVALSQRDAATIRSLADFGSAQSLTPSLVAANPLPGSVHSVGEVVASLTSAGASVGVEGVQLWVKVTTPTAAVYSDYYNSSVVSLSDLCGAGLVPGSYVLQAALADSNGNLYANEEANLTVRFTVDADPTTVVALCPLLPTNQRINGNSISIPFTTPNFVVGESTVGPHVHYRLDAGAWHSWVSGSPLHPLDLEDLPSGQHTVEMYLWDPAHTTPPAATSPRTATCVFFMGASSYASLKLHVDADFVRGPDGSELSACARSVTDVDVGNVYFANIYAPLEVQYVADESSPANPSGAPMVLVGKLRAASSMSGMADAAVATIGSASDTAIFATHWLDGHSVVEFGLQGQVRCSNNAAKFANNRAAALDVLGGVQKTGESELLIADAVRQRAIITYTDLSTQDTYVAWEYDSDRAVADFRLVPEAEKIIAVGAAGVNPEVLMIRAGTIVRWRNDTAEPIQIYSGNTTTAQFNADADLTLYGEDFKSQLLQPGESFSYRFDNLGDFDWFSYPGIITAEVNGVVRVSAGRVSPSDRYLVTENDVTADTVGGRVVQLDAWGNVEWIFGEGILHRPRDARPLPDGSVIIST